ncbi:hypothetical protein BDZ91DRAFT_726206, partial [Kalaharituber pfeilii]
MLLDRLAALIRFSCFSCLYGFGLFHSLWFPIPFKTSTFSVSRRLWIHGVHFVH